MARKFSRLRWANLFAEKRLWGQFGKLREELFPGPRPLLWYKWFYPPESRSWELPNKCLFGGGLGEEGEGKWWSTCLDETGWANSPLLLYRVFFRIKHCIINRLSQVKNTAQKLTKIWVSKLGSLEFLNPNKPFKVEILWFFPFTDTVFANFLFLVGMLGYFLKLSVVIKQMLQGLNTYLPAYSWSLMKNTLIGA